MPTYKPFDWYRTPLYYDMIFDEGTREETNFIEAVTELYCTTKRSSQNKSQLKILEPACGSARLIASLAKRGHNCTGFDLEPGMIDFSEKRLKKLRKRAHLSVADMTDFSYKTKFDLAHCLVSTFKYLLTEDAARTHLQLVANHLKPGGLYILGLHLTPTNQTTRLRERWTAQNKNIHVTCNIQSWPPNYHKRTEAVRSRLIVTPLENHNRSNNHLNAPKPNAQTEFYESSWTFRTYNLKQLQSLITSVPDFTHLATYSFHHDITDPITLGEELDNVLILQKN
ncbi:class I SAM-dependent methyltransferase [Poriferisphaera sp. WC338]|uniref:class I SAM-dependent methyltransferase n=1 Tax=Poriferisphaera sp. WC338 TaxID=3425129 RepID=UPI003D813EC5